MTTFHIITFLIHLAQLSLDPSRLRYNVGNLET